MFDPDDLLAPIDGDAPCGIDMRDPAAAQPRSEPGMGEPEPSANVQDVRGLARAARRAVLDQETADWQVVVTTCSTILRRKSKDTEVAAILVEALVGQDKISGLWTGGVFLAGLLNKFWDGLHHPQPRPETSGAAADTPARARLAPVIELLTGENRLKQVLLQTRLLTVEDQKNNEKQLFYNDVRSAANADPSNSKLWPAIERRYAGDPDGSLAQLAAPARAARDVWKPLLADIQRRLGERVENCAPIIPFCDEILRLVERLAPASSPMPDTVSPGVEHDTDGTPSSGDEPAEAGAPATAAHAPGTSAAQRPGPIRDREAALRQLADIAAFFRRTEPHSPLSYTLDETVRRARLAWPEWLVEAVPEFELRKSILLRLGLPSEPPGDGFGM